MNVDELMDRDELARRLDGLEPPSCMSAADPAAVNVSTSWTEDGMTRWWELAHPSGLVHVCFEDVAQLDGTVNAGDGSVDLQLRDESLTPDEAAQLAEALMWGRLTVASTDERRRRA